MTTGTIGRLVLLTLLAVTGSLVAQQPDSPEAGATKRLSMSSEARAALREAKSVADRVKGTKDAERLQLLEAAARAYEDVARKFDADPAGSAAAWFRAGELWRRHGSLAIAERHYLEAASRDPGRYAQRGKLAAADMQRRQKLLDKAMESYAEVVRLDPGTSRAQKARLWHARLLQTSGRLDEAIGGFRVALEAAERPRQVIEAANWLAKALVAKGDLLAAEETIVHAERAVADEGAVGEEAQRLQKALERMSARRALQRAKDKAAGAGKDARQLERDRQRDTRGK